MLGKLVLLLLQVVIAWLITPVLLRAIPLGAAAPYELFIWAVLVAIVIWLTGVIGAQVLQGVGGPSSATLSWSLGIALIVAALLFFVPGLIPNIPEVALTDHGVVLAAALIGYWIKR